WFGTTPMGAVLMGWVIDAVSPRAPFAIGGVAAAACAVGLVRRRAASEAGPEAGESPAPSKEPALR
ncbi:MAG: hypothetical protein R2694_20925, partial [Ilumatobacteraceae bacterium]